MQTGMSPARIQRRRTRGWRMPADAVYVGRPSRWGNPYRVHHPEDGLWEVRRDDGVGPVAFVASHQSARSHAVSFLQTDLDRGTAPFTVEEIRTALAGRDLACWCPLDQPCHADLLLKISNQKEEA